MNDGYSASGLAAGEDQEAEPGELFKQGYAPPCGPQYLTSFSEFLTITNSHEPNDGSSKFLGQSCQFGYFLNDTSLSMAEIEANTSAWLAQSQTTQWPNAVGKASGDNGCIFGTQYMGPVDLPAFPNSVAIHQQEVERHSNPLVREEVGCDQPACLPQSSTDACSNRSHGQLELRSTPFEIGQAMQMVATHREPLYNLNITGISQSFVVTDAWQADMPIIYASDGFEELTGYHSREVIGRNCRFLQSRNGIVQAGAARQYMSSTSTCQLKEKIVMGREVQQVIMNFRKSGEDLVNLLTLIPIPWDESDGIRFWFGFQTDMSRSRPPLSVSLRPDGRSSLLCRRKALVRPCDDSATAEAGCNPGESVARDAEATDTPDGIDLASIGAGSQAVAMDQHLESKEFSNILEDLMNGGGKCNMFDTPAWNHALLENLDDLVQVLSPKGTIVYASPSWQRLGYSSALLLGTSVRTICHPSDITPVMRKLKNAQVGRKFDMVFRIRQQQGGYSWINNCGSTWNDGGRKWIVLAGRTMDMSTLSQGLLDQSGGLGDRDIWMKLSSPGLILSVFPTHPALGVSAEELVGTSVQDLISPSLPSDAPQLFGQLLCKVGGDNATSATVVIRSARGHNLHFDLTLHPGPTNGSAKPYFLLAHCRMAKSSRRKSPSSTLLFSRALPDHVLGGSGQSSTTDPTYERSCPQSLPPDDNLFAELEADRCGVWQYELHQLATENAALKLELQELQKLSKQRKRSRASGKPFRGCANCHTRQTPEWRRGPSGERDLCNSCGLRWSKSVRKHAANRPG
ncbi:GATA zinc finger protein [Seiridium cupressi]